MPAVVPRWGSGGAGSTPCPEVWGRRPCAWTTRPSAPSSPAIPPFPAPTPFEHTTLVVVATDARVSKAECQLLAQSAHDGLAQAIRPAHTRYDGDFAAVLATGEVDAHPDRLRVAATETVARAIRAAVQGSP